MRARRHLPYGAVIMFSACCLFANPVTGRDSGVAPTGPSACGPRFAIHYDPGFPNTFIIENLSKHGWTLEVLTIDLSSSFGQAVFDTSPGSMGQEAPHSFYKIKTTGSSVDLDRLEPPSGNAHVMTLKFNAFPPSGKIIFVVDLDDRSLISSRGPHRVTFGELADAKVSARMRGPAKYPAHIEATFNQTPIPGRTVASSFGAPFSLPRQAP